MSTVIAFRRRRRRLRGPGLSRLSPSPRGLMALMIAGAIAGLVLLELPGTAGLRTGPDAPEGPVETVPARAFPVCGSGERISCVVDGDTFYLSGEKIRIADIDTPEVFSPSCRREAELGHRATLRLQSLLAAGAFELHAGPRERDRYGRTLRTVTRDGHSLGAVLVAEGLAHEWNGHRGGWCG